MNATECTIQGHTTSSRLSKLKPTKDIATTKATHEDDSWKNNSGLRFVEENPQSREEGTRHPVEGFFRHARALPVYIDNRFFCLPLLTSVNIYVYIYIYVRYTEAGVAKVEHKEREYEPPDDCAT